MNATILDEVGDILRRTAGQVVMPRFTMLQLSESEFKAPGEPVTVADREAEAMIALGLRALVPGARVVGEEACATNPALLDHLGDGLVWLIDPIDGTANFVAGLAPFAMMVALLLNGETIGSWILDPVDNRLAVAELGSGAWIEGERIIAANVTPEGKDLHGIISTAFCPPDRLKFVERLQAAIGDVVPTARCAGHEYPLVATRHRDIALYWRTLAWDHAPGALLLTEAGGSVSHIDGSPYRPVQPKTGLLLAHNVTIMTTLRELMLACAA